jgi:glycosyltransferase involved in cell wall biosynthesis
MTTVQILLSTYNGARYLEPLVESVAMQDWPDLDVLVRDDGSSDDTLALLQELSARHRRMTVQAESNVGFVQSFFRLLELSSPAADYLAFCDQDDVWHRDKISRAVATLRSYPDLDPLLYCSRLELVDQDLRHLGYSAVPRRGVTFRNALVECPLQGCTVVINRAARHLLLGGLPAHAFSHDWWMYLVISAFGTVVYDEEAHIRYRCHGSNVFGASLRTVDRVRVHGRRFLDVGASRPVAAQAAAFMRAYGSSLGDEHQSVLRRFLASRQPVWRRLAYACHCDVYRQSRISDAILRLLIAVDRL